MIRRIATVGGWTLVSRVTGFLRDVVMAAILGAGPIADAFVVAFRLPNHFRAIFAEGAFSAAFLPRYAATLETDGLAAARAFADRLAAAMVALQLVLLAIAGWRQLPKPALALAGPVAASGFALALASLAHDARLELITSAILFPLFTLWVIVVGLWLRRSEL